MSKILLFSILSFSVLAQNPSDYDFYNFSGGNYLELKTDDLKNSIQRGNGEFYSKEQRDQFDVIFSQPSLKLQWELRDLTNGATISNSLNLKEMFYGASLSKIFVASTFVSLSNDLDIDLQTRQELNDLIVKSSNLAWGSLQNKIGKGNENFGRKKIQSFLNNICIYDSIGYRGYLDDIHGNEINVADVSTFIQSSFNQEYEHSKEIFKLLFISRTGKSRLKKYFPSSMIMGGKTGTYKGNTTIQGRRVITDSNHHLIVFYYNYNYYSLVVLSDGVAQEKLSVLAFGLFNKYIK